MSTAYEVVKAWRKKNPEKVTAQGARYRERHPDTCAAKARRYRERNLDAVRAADAERHRMARKNDPVAQARRNRAFKERAEAARVAQAGRPRPAECELCGEPARTVFDHCHDSGRFRGWICDRCNRVLGSVNDDPMLLAKMIGYLGRPGGEADDSSQERAS